MEITKWINSEIIFLKYIKDTCAYYNNKDKIDCICCDFKNQCPYSGFYRNRINYNNIINILIENRSFDVFIKNIVTKYIIHSRNKILMSNTQNYIFLMKLTKIFFIHFFIENYFKLNIYNIESIKFSLKIADKFKQFNDDYSNISYEGSPYIHMYIKYKNGKKLYVNKGYNFIFTNIIPFLILLYKNKNIKDDKIIGHICYINNTIKFCSINLIETIKLIKQKFM